MGMVQIQSLTGGYSNKQILKWIKWKKYEQQHIIEGNNKLCCKQDLSSEEQIWLNNFQSQLNKLFLECIHSGWMSVGFCKRKNCT